MQVADMLVRDVLGFASQAEEQRALGVENLPPIPEAGPVTIDEVPRAGGTIDDTVASPSVRRPSRAVRTSNFPESKYSANRVEFMANIPVMDNDLLIESAGVLVVSGFVASGAGVSTISLTLEGRDSSTNAWAYLNEGANLVVGAMFREEIEVSAGDAVNLRFGSNTTATLRITLGEGM